MLLLRPSQITLLDKAQVEWRRAQIRMSARQVTKNVSYTGGFLGMLASLPARALPTILTGLKTGLLSGGINKGCGHALGIWTCMGMWACMCSLAGRHAWTGMHGQACMDMHGQAFMVNLNFEFYYYYYFVIT